ncbi:snRNA-activating protein complex subunit 2 [Bufo gargarizans]|uniref:snRNA-activating protein complex subunit 2 n=1 Tax=Bufo gargarizans TaxID=30331 RepID=UPI001CF50252|nr:snRNA-activating protein complex subunit 2 [Bufo gargarizans]
MKPPTRKRAAPRRYDAPTAASAPNLRLVWTTREKKELLQGLRSQMNEKTPEVTVQGRSDAEVSSYFAWLRGRAAREAMQMEYGRLVRQKKIHENQDPAAIELWTDLASRICSATEDAMTAAFSQVLTIASTEPVTLRHSIPCKEPPAIPGQTSSPCEKSPQHKGSSEEELSSAGEEPTTANGGDGWNSLDFEKIYKYLSKTVRGEALPKLSDFESAVILHLLRCIPDQFQHLDAPHIGPYLYDTYTFLTTELESGHTERAESQSVSQTPNWKELGFCPLNPFMIPLEMLRHKEERVTPP